jgi:NitT/TauT family transport system ATP-binding protein
LRAILGTHPPKQGEILADGYHVKRPGRNVGIVYQDYSLYDFLTSRGNVAFGLMLDQTSLSFRMIRPLAWRRLRHEQLRRAEAMLRKVELTEAAHLYPSEMSGGMRQRVAIAQALIMQPKILLLDEPFGALDEATREEMQLMLRQLSQENAEAVGRGEAPPYTILIVTHELNEALYVADRVIGLSQYHQNGIEGATIIYDKSSPVYRPATPGDFEGFEAQKEELRQSVFNPANKRHHSELVTFWASRGRQACH